MNNSPNLGDWIQRHQEDQLVIARCLVWLVHVRSRLLPQLLLPAAWKKKKKKTLPTMHGLSRSTIYICQEDTSLKKPFLDVNTGSLLLLLLLLCFWVLGGRTLPHGSLSLSFSPLSLCFDLLCFFPWLESSRGVVLYMLHWVRLGTMMTFTSCHPFSFLYYLFQTSSNNKYEKSSSKCHYFLISGLTWCCTFHYLFQIFYHKVNDDWVSDSSTKG